eukprot:361217-Chlamydomonas_euryale.AAC.5
MPPECVHPWVLPAYLHPLSWTLPLQTPLARVHFHAPCRVAGIVRRESSKGLTSLTSTDATVDILTDRSEGPERNPTMLGTARHAGTGVFTAKHPAPPAPIISGEATSAFTLSDESDEEQDVHVFVGDLANNVTDAVLHKAFSAVGPCRQAG